MLRHSLLLLALRDALLVPPVPLVNHALSARHGLKFAPTDAARVDEFAVQLTNHECHQSPGTRRANSNPSLWAVKLITTIDTNTAMTVTTSRRCVLNASPNSQPERPNAA